MVTPQFILGLQSERHIGSPLSELVVTTHPPRLEPPELPHTDQEFPFLKLLSTSVIYGNILNVSDDVRSSITGGIPVPRTDELVEGQLSTRVNRN